ncbi:UNVERIFIED_ORG: hypothetical protein ABIB19_000898 [Arthrobacter sp. UYEF10]
MNPRDTRGFQDAVATANVIKASGQFPDHDNQDPPILPASATHHREKKMTAATGAPQRRTNFRTGSMPVTISTAITPFSPYRCNLNPKAR